MSDRSIVEYFAEHEKYKCGYCGQKDTNYSHGMWTHSLTVEDYQALIDRGWRRSGKYTYKPTMNQTCCPQYTIRCDATRFKISKSHKKVIKRVNRFLNTGVRPPKADKEAERDEDCQDDDFSPKQVIPGADRQGTEGVGVDPVPSTTSGTKATRSAPTTRDCDNLCDTSVKNHSKVEKKAPKPGAGADPSKPLCRKAREQRVARWQEKQSRKPQNLTAKHNQEKKSNSPKSLEVLLGEVSENAAHKLELRLVRSSPRSEDFKESFNEAHAVYLLYQMQIHKDPADKPSVKQYTRFLVDSPLQEMDGPDGFPGFGSFHQQYLLDGKIIGVGVIDILPHCVSSVYLYYDPDYSFLSLGTYSALRELAFTQELQKSVPSLLYYYMGFYIHSCAKMRYKGQFVPSYILCPEVYTFEAIEDARPKMDAANYARLTAPDKVDADGDVTLGDVMVLHRRTAMPYAMYQQLSIGAEDEIEVLEYSGYVGKTCAERMLLYRA